MPGPSPQLTVTYHLDETSALNELQHYDGEIEEVDLSTWRSMDLEIAAAPEDWSGSVDVVERDDLGYSETGMSDIEGWHPHDKP